jgi:hypothetical protein
MIGPKGIRTPTRLKQNLHNFRSLTAKNSQIPPKVFPHGNRLRGVADDRRHHMGGAPTRRTGLPGSSMHWRRGVPSRSTTQILFVFCSPQVYRDCRESQKEATRRRQSEEAVEEDGWEGICPMEVERWQTR